LCAVFASANSALSFQSCAQAHAVVGALSLGWLSGQCAK
jgi:hypothetical protein